MQQRKCQPFDFSLWLRQQGQGRGNRWFVRLRVFLQRMFGNQLFDLRALMENSLKIGSRGSKLALWQANWVKTAIESRQPSIPVEIVVIRTRGDKILDVPLAKVGGKGLFVKEIETALLAGRIDLAVHSMKDMPADLPQGLCIGAVPVREQPQDVIISRGEGFETLKRGALIGTSSLRRAAQLRHIRPDLKILPLRGNLDTRIKKLDDGDMDAVVLAAAGVIRLGLQDRITEYLSETVMLPAAGQGALCIEIRQGEGVIGPLMDRLNDPATHTAVLAERSFLHRLEGSCQVPIAAHGTLENDTLHLSGMIADIDGSLLLRDSISGPATQPEAIGKNLAERLIDQGAADILKRLNS